MTLKKVINLSEATTERLIVPIAEEHGARVLPKLRFADVIDIDRSGISDRQYTYALKSHLDFLVVDEGAQPLFAVEFDGRGHNTGKNALCERFGLPLARIRREHVFERDGTVRYLEWLCWLFFSHQNLLEAQESGYLPPTEFPAPILTVTHPSLEGDFPLWLSRQCRQVLHTLYNEGRIVQRVPTALIGEARDSHTKCLAFVALEESVPVMGKGSVYLRGFGVTASEAAEEIALVDLFTGVSRYLEAGDGAVESGQLRAEIVKFLKLCERPRLRGDLSGKLGFDMSMRWDLKTHYWVVGPVDDDGAQFVHESTA